MIRRLNTRFGPMKRPAIASGKVDAPRTIRAIGIAATREASWA